MNILNHFHNFLLILYYNKYFNHYFKYYIKIYKRFILNN